MWKRTVSDHAELAIQTIMSAYLSCSPERRKFDTWHRALARGAGKTILSAHPEASIAAVRAGHPMRHLVGYFGKLVEGLRLAGLREHQLSLVAQMSVGSGSNVARPDSKLPAAGNHTSADRLNWLNNRLGAVTATGPPTSVTSPRCHGQPAAVAHHWSLRPLQGPQRDFLQRGGVPSERKDHCGRFPSSHRSHDPAFCAGGGIK